MGKMDPTGADTDEDDLVYSFVPFQDLVRDARQRPPDPDPVQYDRACFSHALLLGV